MRARGLVPSQLVLLMAALKICVTVPVRMIFFMYKNRDYFTPLCVYQHDLV